MPRIRSLKPEAFQSESLSRVSLGAERTLFGLSTQVDDRGRIADKPAQLNGFLWAMRGGHSAGELDAELGELSQEGIVCRYTGCDGRRYLHLVAWDEHQSINRPSESRLPRCPVHTVSTGGVAERCGRHEGDCLPFKPSLNPHGGLTEPSTLDRGSRTVDLGEGSRRETAPQAPPKRAKPPAARQPASRGIRIPDDFAVTAGMAAWGASEHPHVDLRAETAKFRDYWRSKPGSAALKTDWAATWRNWIRRAADSQPARASPRGRQAATDALFDEAMQTARSLDAKERDDQGRDRPADPLRGRVLPAAGD